MMQWLKTHSWWASASLQKLRSCVPPNLCPVKVQTYQANVCPLSIVRAISECLWLHLVTVLVSGFLAD